MSDPIALAVPFFFLLIGIEVAWAKKRGVKVYRLTDALTNLSCGITSQVTMIAWAALHIAIYAWVYEHWRFVTISRPWLTWVIAFIGVDFVYYWWHRLSHEVNVLWAAHVVHHQSEDYNLAVALRQAVLTSWTALPFYLTLAFLGVPTLVWAVAHALSTLYQFWIHTQLVGKIRGPLDWILNLPSHHRVHHAINPKYLDKNYGATLIVWDRLFGTYAEEEETPIYGITKPLGTFDPMWAQLHYWFEMVAMMRSARRPLDKVRVWIASPAWKPEGYELAAIEPIHTRPKFDRPLSPQLVRYLFIQFVLIGNGAFAMMMWHRRIPTLALIAAGIATLLGLVTIGALIEGRRWAKPVEAVRIALGIGATAFVVMTTMTGCSEETPAPEGPAEIQVIGRFDTSTLRPMTGWPGGRIVVRFEGTDVQMTLTQTSPVNLDGDDPLMESSWFNVIVDGKVENKLEVSGQNQVVDVVKGLPQGVHIVELEKRTGPTHGSITLDAVEFPNGGKLLSPPARKSRRIEFLSDSTIDGYGVDGDAKTCTAGDGSLDNVRKSAAHFIATSLDAEPHILAYTGKGLVENEGGDTTTDRFPDLYDRTLPDVASSVWDFKTWIPDAVVISLGGTDITSTTPPANFEAAYDALVTSVRKHYPSAHIFMTVWSQIKDLDPPDGFAQRKTLQSVLDKIAATHSSDKNLHVFVWKEADYPGDETACAEHANETHAKETAAEIAPVIKKALGW